MNTEAKARQEIIKFLQSDKKVALIKGTHQYDKHFLVMRMLEENYRNAKVLFRLNSLQNTTTDSILGLSKQPKAGEYIKIGKNHYAFDSFLNSGTWHKTALEFDFAIFYPLDAVLRGDKLSSIENITKFKNIGKIFLVTWTDHKDDDYKVLSQLIEEYITYDVEEKDLAYHNRMIELL
jgi:hypothetical protein